MDRLVERVEDCTLAVNLLDGWKDSVRNECHSLLETVNDAKRVLAEKDELAVMKNQIQQLEILYQKYEAMERYIEYLENNYPKKEPIEHSVAHEKTIEVKPKETAKKLAPQTPISETRSTKIPSSQAKSSIPQPQRNWSISINYVTDEDLKSVPQYMKGRITSSEVNAVVEGYNVTLNKKYDLLKLSKASLKVKNDLDQWILWKSQETPSLKGSYFCTAKDLDVQGCIKMSKKNSNIIMILRHLKLVKEVREKNTTFYVACF